MIKILYCKLYYYNNYLGAFLTNLFFHNVVLFYWDYIQLKINVGHRCIKIIDIKISLKKVLDIDIVEEAYFK